MLSRLLRWVGGGGRKPRERSRRRRIGPLGCLLWLLALVILVLVLSVLFGGFQKGTRVGIGGAPGTPRSPSAAGLTSSGLSSSGLSSSGLTGWPGPAYHP